MNESLFSYGQIVPKAWVDYNQHMNDAEYNRFFSDVTDAYLAHVGLTHDKIDELAYTIFTLENHTVYLKEVKENTKITGEVILHDFDNKKLHLFISLYDDAGDLCATYEVMLLGLNQTSGRPDVFPTEIFRDIDNYNDRQKISEKPSQIGRAIGIRGK